MEKKAWGLKSRSRRDLLLSYAALFLLCKRPIICLAGFQSFVRSWWVGPHNESLATQTEKVHVAQSSITKLRYGSPRNENTKKSLSCNGYSPTVISRSLSKIVSDRELARFSEAGRFYVSNDAGVAVRFKPQVLRL